MERAITGAIFAIILAALVSCGGSTSSSDVPDARIRIYMKGSDFHCCGIETVQVAVDGKNVGTLRNQGIGADWTVEVEAFVKAGTHNLVATSNSKSNGTYEEWRTTITIVNGQTFSSQRLKCNATWCGS